MISIVKKPKIAPVITKVTTKFVALLNSGVRILIKMFKRGEAKTISVKATKAYRAIAHFKANFAFFGLATERETNFGKSIRLRVTGIIIDIA